MTRKSPVAVFAYRRPHHLSRTLDSLTRCSEYHLHPIFVFSDGPRTPEIAPDVEAVRELIARRRTSNMTVIERDSNWGLANSIISATTDLCSEFGKAIVIEDDLLLHRSTLNWFENALNLYQDRDEIMHVGAYQYRIPQFQRRQEGVLQRFTSSWGWATWQRAWSSFDPLAVGWERLGTDAAMRRDFDLGNTYPFSEMLEKQMSNRIDSWAIRWWWSVFRAGGFSVMPPRSLVANTGVDASGTHNTVGAAKRFLSGPIPLMWEGLEAPTLPTDPRINSNDERDFRKALLRTNAWRNSKIKKLLAASGLKRFA